MGISQVRVTQITNNTNFGKISNLLTQGRDLGYIARHYHMDLALVWSIALEGKSDQDRFESLNWGLRTCDHWYFNDLDQRFGDDWPARSPRRRLYEPEASPERLAMAGRPGQIPAQLVAHALFYFTQEGDLIFDPMAGGGVVPDTCLAFNRKCWSFDLIDRPETRPEIEPHQWNPEYLVWPVIRNHLGHEDIQSTTVYLHLDLKRKREIQRQLT